MAQWIWRAMLLLVVVCVAPSALASELPPAPFATASVAAHVLPPRAAPEGRKIRATLRNSRLVTITGWAFAGTATVMGLAAAGSSRYDFKGEWYEKAAYDRIYTARSSTSTGMGIAAAALGASGLVLAIGGTFGEMGALHHIGLMRTTVGWVGMSFLIAGSVGLSLGGLGFVPLIAGGTLAGVGLIVLAAQFGLNVRVTQKKLTPDQYIDLYGRPRRHKPQLTVAPTVLDQGAGLVLVGRF